MTEELNKEESAALQRPNYQEELVQIMKSSVSPKVLREKVSDYHEKDIALAMQEVTREDRFRLYRVLDGQTLSDIFEYLPEDGPYFSELTPRKKVKVLSFLETDTAVRFLRQQSRKERDMLLDLMDDEAKRDIAMIASFDEDEIGSRMTTNYISLQMGLSTREAMREVVRQAAENDNISTIYVLDEDRSFYGAVGLKDLIIAGEKGDLEALVVTSYPYVYGQEPVEECIERLKEYNEDSIPVLDNENKLLGVIRSRDIMEAVEDEMGEDYAKLAGLSAEADLEESVGDGMSKRLPWLVILLVLGMGVSSVVGLFESVVAQLTIIISFQSLILDMAGNVGTQSLAVTIRVLMGEQLRGKDKRTLIWKESKVAVTNGVLLGAMSFLMIGLYLWIMKGKPMFFSFAVSACIGLALIVVMFISGMAGTVIPILFKKMGVDPAVASGPLITTLNDLFAVLSYYGLIWLVLIQILHLTD